MWRPKPSPARRGTLLVVVLGLITIFLALMLAITVRVYNSTKNGTVLQQHVQAYLMMIAAKKVIYCGGAGSPVTGGEDTNLYDLCKRPYAASLGWFRINTTGGTNILAVGGSSGVDGPKLSLNAGDPNRNAYEVRLFYHVTSTSPEVEVALQPVADNATYW